MMMNMVILMLIIMKQILSVRNNARFGAFRVGASSALRPGGCFMSSLRFRVARRIAFRNAAFAFALRPSSSSSTSSSIVCMICMICTTCMIYIVCMISMICMICMKD